MADTHISAEFVAPKDKLGKLKTLWGFVKPYTVQVWLAGFFLLVAALTVLIIPSAVQGIIDTGFGDGAANSMAQYGGFFAVIVVVMAASTALRFYYVTWLGERVVADIRKAVYERLIDLSPAYFDDNRPSEIVSRLTADTTLVQTIVGSSVSVWVRNLLIAIVGTVWLFVMNPRLMAIILVVLPVMLAIVVTVGKRLRNLSRSSQDRVADVGSRANESLTALPVVQAFTQEKQEAGRFSDFVENAFLIARKRIRVRAGLTALMIFLGFGAIAGVMLAGIENVNNGTMTGGEILAFIMRATFVAGAFAALTEVYSELQRAAGAAGRLAELLRVISPIQPPANPVPLPKPTRGEVRFEDIRFAYPSRPSVDALSGFNLTLRPGETVALVGPSGAGKSTVLQLLLRFYDPQGGRITLDGVDLRQMDPTDFRTALSLVPQDTIVFAASIADNIRYGCADASDQDVRAAARAAAASDFIEALPDGYDTMLGERGARLSGGQRQRLAIARAILRDAPLLLLDEATSALDAESELAVQQALERLKKNRTTLVIAHRLATVKAADRIIVMQDGMIAAEGAHSDLTNKGGLYSRLAELQFIA